MFEEKTFEQLLNEKLALVPDDLDKREGSIIYDTLAPNSVEAAQMYIALNSVLIETFADTASREYLIKRCRERGISPRPATFATAVGEFNKEVEIGSRFSCDKFNYVVTQRRITEGVTDYKYLLICETAGREPNNISGDLIPIDYIDGLTFAQLHSPVILGEDEEDTESLRARYFDSFINQAYGFNKAQYKSTAEAIGGVGGCKPIRAWNGGGTVKLILTDSEYGVPSPQLISDVQNIFDPGATGDGMGIAPIDHAVTVVGVTGEAVNINASIEYKNGWNFAECKTEIKSAVDRYLQSLNKDWSKSESLIVRISRLEAELLSVEGINDISDTTLNGSSANLAVASDKIVLRGTFNGEEL